LKQSKRLGIRSLKRWGELTHFVDDGDVPISNNWVENHIRRLRWEDRTGSSQAACVLANGRPRS
jgi:hypothetical protein